MPAFTAVPDGSITTPEGFSVGTATANLGTTGAPDVAVVISEHPCSGAGVFTKNRVKAAHVVFDQGLLLERPGRLRGVVMNSQLANACTGAVGLNDTAAMAQLTEEAAGLPNRCVLTLSTGVIGKPLPMDRLRPAISAAVDSLSHHDGIDAARAIMTTDRATKHLALRIETAAGVVTVGGIAKGSSMIHPDMATMLGLMTTDAQVDAAQLGALLRSVSDRTFNAITVDGGTSPNDTVLMLANGASKVPIARDAEGWKLFGEAVEEVARELALMIVRDGDGATRFIELTVTGASTDAMARAVGRHIGSSLLVKSSIGGGDANWGRVLAAAGSSEFPVHADRLALSAQVRHEDGGPSGDWVVLARGGALAASDEREVAEIFGGSDLALRLDLGIGSASATVWTCDLTSDYVRLNSTP